MVYQIIMPKSIVYKMLTLDFSIVSPKKKTRLINEQTIKHFQALLKDETWDTLYKTTCVNEMYNRFQCIFLRHYEASFPVFYIDCRSNDNNWVTKGIKISCTKKRELYSLYRNNKDNIQIKDNYKKYCNLLKRVINEAQKENNTSIIR